MAQEPARYLVFLLVLTLSLVGMTIAIAPDAASPARAASPTRGPLRVHPENGRYFIDADGMPVLLTGSHTWSNLVDNGAGFPPPAFDYGAYLDFLYRQEHNFFRMWTWEQARGSTETADEDYWYDPLPWIRSGPGLALDGRPKHDLSRLDPDWLRRLHDRVDMARASGFYVSIMLFNGWSVSADKGGHAAGNPWQGHPMHRDNNVDGIDGDPDGTGSGEAVHSLRLPEVTAVQTDYLRAVIETLADMDNVLYEISNESHGGSEAWQYRMIETVRSIEDELGVRHPEGMTVEWPGGDNADLYASPADWISPNGSLDDPPPADGRKVILADTDHLCGICGDRAWAWKAFTRGQHPIFMDGYDGEAYGSGGAGFDFDDPRWLSLRANLGFIRRLSEDLGSSLADMVPRPELCSTRYCLAGGDGERIDQAMLVYAPSGGPIEVDLSTWGSTEYSYSPRWLDPETGSWRQGEAWVPAGSQRRFQSPFGHDAVLRLEAAGWIDPGTEVPTPGPAETPSPTTDAKRLWLPRIAR